MQKVMKFVKGILATLLLLCSYNASAYDFEAVNDDGVTIYYNIASHSNLTCEVTNGGTYSGDVVIPKTVTYDNNTYTVTIIDSGAFEHCSSLKSVTIPESVTRIRSYAFAYSSLESITIPDGVTSIAEEVFWGCTSLTSITIPNSVTSIEYGTFGSCTSLTSINIPESVTSIGDNAFSACTSLTSINIPESVTSIGIQAFVTSSLTSLTIPGSVTSIGNFAFELCSSLTSVTILDGLTRIGDGVFEYCSNLTSITIPESVTSIGYNAFYDCSSLTSITIPNSVTKIGGSAFMSCSSLHEVTSLNPEPPTCASDTFLFVDTSRGVLYVPKEALEAYKTAKVWKNFGNIEEIDVTPVIGIEADTQAEELYRYTIDGKRIDAPQKGINIIKYSDGTTKKVLVK